MSSDTPDLHNAADVTITDAFIESANRLIAEEGSDYGDFGNDEEELEIIEQLLAQNASKAEEQESFVVTDIEDYEPPRGVRLPKVLGLERTRLWETAPSQSSTQILCDVETASCKGNVLSTSSTLTLTRN
jgi:hypothetical protein